MTKVTVFGAGKMGSAIGAVFAGGGAEIAHITSQTPDATVDGDIVVLAVPYAAVSDIVARYGEQLTGKVVIDVTNPIDFRNFSFLVPADGSAAAEIAAALPGTSVLKGFNTTFVQTLTDPDRTAVVLLAGDDADAKTRVGDAIRSGGFSAIDAGPLSAARELEAFAQLQIRLAIGGRIRRLEVIPV